MLNKIASYLTRILQKNHIIQEEFFDVYVYGFELLLSSLFSTTVIILAGLCMHRVLETIVFLLVFILLRSYSGGYHATKFSLCTITTFCVYAIVMVFSFFLVVNLLAFAILGGVGLALLCVFAPIENPNKELSTKRKRIYKVVSIIIFLGFDVFGILTMSQHPTISSVAFYALSTDLLLMIPGILKKGAKSDEIL